MKHKTITQQAAASTRLFFSFLFGEQAFQCLLCVVVLCYSCVYDSSNNKIKSQTKIFKLCIVLQYLEYGFSVAILILLLLLLLLLLLPCCSVSENSISITVIIVIVMYFIIFYNILILVVNILLYIYVYDHDDDDEFFN